MNYPKYFEQNNDQKSQKKKLFEAELSSAFWIVPSSDVVKFVWTY